MQCLCHNAAGLLRSCTWQHSCLPSLCEGQEGEFDHLKVKKDEVFRTVWIVSSNQTAFVKNNRRSELVWICGSEW